MISEKNFPSTVASAHYTFEKENFPKLISYQRHISEEEETRHFNNLLTTPNTEKRQGQKNPDREFLQNAQTNSIQINVKKRMILSPEQVILSTNKTPLQERKIINQGISPRKRTFMEVDANAELLLYAPMKGLKLKESSFKTDKIRLFNGTKNKNPIFFRVFQDSLLGISRSKQKKIHCASIDDDCQTDSEQIQLAIQHSKKELVEAMKSNKRASPNSDEESCDDSECTSGNFYSLLSQTSTESLEDVRRRLNFDDY